MDDVMIYKYKYARPAVTADCVVFAFDDEGLKILLIQRAQDPFKDQWALPGGFAEVGESIEDTARRELEEETGLKVIFLEQLYTFSAPDRDPREHVMTVAHYALINAEQMAVRASSDALNANWFIIPGIPKLAFDHADIVHMAVSQLQQKCLNTPICFKLLPNEFTMRGLQHFYEQLLDRKLDMKSFSTKILKMEILDILNDDENDSSCKTEQFYRFNEMKYARRHNKGFLFDI